MSSSPQAFVSNSNKYHLTIGDFLNMPLDQPVKVFILHGIFETSCAVKNNSLHTPTKPSEFFKSNGYVLLTRKVPDAFSCEAAFFFGNGSTLVKDVSLQVNVSRSEEGVGLYEYLDKDGRVPHTHRHECLNSAYKIDDEYKGKHWSELPKTKRIGLSGPVMLFDDMDKCPEIVLKQDGYLW